MSRYSKSGEIFRRAKELIPGGVNSPARAFGAVGGNPLVIDRAEGARLYDVDGNRLIDYVLSWGPMILGHTHPSVTEALEKAIRKGTSYGAPTVNENVIAELVVEMVPSIEKVRLVNSGTEATSSAIRLARGWTGRDKIVKFRGCYHGHVDSLLVAAGSAAATLGVPDSPGVTRGMASDTLLLDYNDIEGVRNLFDRMGEEIAGVIVEPVAGNMGCVPGSLEFLTTLRELTSRYGAILIFDEVMSGFRVARGGAQERFEILPDLTTLGKVIGGGLPVGAYGGKREIMDGVIPVGKVFQAGTLSGNPLATAAGIATLSILREDDSFYPTLEAKTKRLAEGLADAARSVGIRTVPQYCGGMFTLFFNDEKDEAITDWSSASRCRTDRFAQYFWGMIDGGVYLPCSQYETNFTSSAHSDAIIDQTLETAEKVFQKMARE